MHRPARRLALGVAALAIAATLVGVAPAQADSDLSAPGGVLFPGCHDYPVTIEVSYPGAASWSAQVSASTPDGAYATGFYSYGTGGTATQDDAVFLCGDEGHGDWRLDGTVTYLDADGQELASEEVAASMPMVRTSTRTTLRTSDRTPLRGQVVSFLIGSRERHRAGWRANRNDAVSLAARCGTASWERVPAKRFTNVAGTLVVRARYVTSTDCRLRATTLPATDARASSSRVVRLTPGTAESNFRVTVPPTAQLPQLG